MPLIHYNPSVGAETPACGLDPNIKHIRTRDKDDVTCQKCLDAISSETVQAGPAGIRHESIKISIKNLRSLIKEVIETNK